MLLRVLQVSVTFIFLLVTARVYLFEAHLSGAITRLHQPPQASMCKVFVLNTITPFIDEAMLKATLAREGHKDTFVSERFMQQAGPALFVDGIISSPYLVTNISDADVVLVDTSRLSLNLIFEFRGMQQLPRHSIRHFLKRLYKSSAWNISRGTGFVFMAPHPLELNMIFGKDFACSHGRNSYFLVVEPGQLCTSIQAINASIIPYNTLAHAHLSTSSVLNSKRVTTLWIRANCGNYTFAGMLLRRHVIHLLSSVSNQHDDIIASCNSEIQPHRIDHRAVIKEMLHSRWCIVVAGDTQSSRRVSEVMLTGCVPIFIGPPWHILPFSRRIPWQEFSLFINMSSVYHSSNATTLQPLVRVSPLDTSIDSERVLHVDDVYDMVQHIRKISQKKHTAMQHKLVKYRCLFEWKHLSVECSASLATLQDICQYASTSKSGQHTRQLATHV